MSQTTNFGIVLPEGTDTFNPLTFNNNAFTKVDQVMKANQDRGITTATHTFIDGINTILRSVATCNALVFVASSDYVAGSTIAVDGVTMTFRYADGTAPKSGAFKTNQAVMCYINGTILTMISAGSIPDINASSVAFDNTESQLEATNVQDAVDEINGKILNGIKLKSLWTNNAPTQSVAGSTTFTLNDNYLNYDYVEAIFRISTNSDRTFSNGKMDVKSQINGIATSLSNIMVYRNYSLKNGNQIIFEGGRSVNTYNTGVVEDNAVCIPVEIIGYKIIR